MWITRYKWEYGNLLKLGAPVVVTQLGMIVVAFADTIMVGRCGTNELAAAAFVNSIFTIGIVMLIGFANGLTPLIGSLFSGGDNDKLREMMRAGVISNVLLAIGFAAVFGIGYFFIDRMGQPDELIPLARPYYLIMLSTLLPISIFNAFQQTSNGCGDTVTPMWIMILCNVVNIAGNWVLINGEFGFPRLGLTGAGLSTMLARYLSMILIVAVFFISRKKREYVRGWKRGENGALGRNCKRVWVTSYPVMIQSGIECVMWSLGGVVCGWFGSGSIAAYQVVVTISQLGFMVYLGIGVAVSVRVANFNGLKDYTMMRRITVAGLHLMLMLATMASVVFYVFAAPMIEVFTTDKSVEAAALPLIIPLILYQYGDAIQITYANALRGATVVKPLLWVSVIAYIVVGSPVMLWLADGLEMGNVGVYYSFSVALFAASFGYWYSFRRIKSPSQVLPARGGS